MQNKGFESNSKRNDSHENVLKIMQLLQFSYWQHSNQGTKVQVDA